jgi:hypothetical protein
LLAALMAAGCTFWTTQKSQSQDASAGVAAPIDTVVIRRSGNSSGRITSAGMIEEYNGRVLILRFRAGPGGAETYPAEDVLEVKTEHVAQHLKGLELYRGGRTLDAGRELELALQQEPRKWVRREILARLVACDIATENWPQAAERFLLLHGGDPDLRHFRFIPVTWRPPTLAPDAVLSAVKWLQDERDVARLIAASWLLNHPTHGTAARNALTILQRNADSRIAFLALAQEWRLRSTAGLAAVEQSRIWQRRIDDAPESLRSGPYSVLARAYAAQDRYEPAAALWLWPMLADDERYDLASHGGLEAAQIYQRLRRTEDAAAILREVETRFPESVVMTEVQALLQDDLTSRDSRPE